MALKTTLEQLEAVQTAIEKVELGQPLLFGPDTLDINMLAKLLQIIKGKEFERLGSTKVIKVDIRFISGSQTGISGCLRCLLDQTFAL